MRFDDLIETDEWRGQTNEALRNQLTELAGRAALPAAVVLAERDDPAGVAALARAATMLATAWPALACCERLGLEDMLPESYRSAEWRTQAAAVDCLEESASVEWIELDARRTVLWPRHGLHEWRPAQISVYAVGLAGQPTGLVVVGPQPSPETDESADSAQGEPPIGWRRYLARGYAALDVEDRFALAAGSLLADGLTPYALADISPETVRTMLGRRAYLYLANPRLCWAAKLADQPICALAADAPHGRHGALVGCENAEIPLWWIQNAGEAERAAWVWLGRYLLALHV